MIIRDLELETMEQGDVYYNLSRVDGKYQFEVQYKMREEKDENDRVLFKSLMSDAICPHDISTWLRFCDCYKIPRCLCGQHAWYPQR